MKISVVMAVYNGENYIIEQLTSILNQTCPVDDVIMIDDCSKDGSYVIIEKFIRDNNLSNWKIIKNEHNLGYRENFKKGLSLVDGDIVFLCDQDDRWHNDKVEKMVEVMKDDRIMSLASSFNFMNQDGKLFNVELKKGKGNNNLLEQIITNKLTQIPLKTILKANFSQGCTMVLRKELVQEFINKSTGKLPHDWELNIISAAKHACYYLDDPLIDYRIHDSNTIGLDDAMGQNILEEKGKRVNQRIDLTKKELENVYVALNHQLMDDDKKMCLRKKEYLETRIKYMEDKKSIKFIKLFISGFYKEFGQFKTFLGDIINVFKG